MTIEAKSKVMAIMEMGLGLTNPPNDGFDTSTAETVFALRRPLGSWFKALHILGRAIELIPFRVKGITDHKFFWKPRA